MSTQSTRTEIHQKADDQDVVVVGAGLVGAVLAIALRQAGYRVGLIDSRAVNVRDTCAVSTLDQRTTAVSASSAMILDALGLWAPDEACPITRIEVSQLGRFGTTRIDSCELNVDALGFVLNNADFSSRLYQQLMQDSGIQITAPARVCHVEQAAASVVVTADDADVKTRHSARLVIAVDGSSSTVRELLGIGTESKDYDQVAIVTSVESELDHQGKAYERFTPDGPLAFLPVSEKVSSIVFTVAADQAAGLLAMSDQRFLAQLQSRFGQRLGALVNCGQRESYPLMFTQSKQTFDRRVLFLGNAARTLHPVAGQGFNLAMRDVGKLIELVGQHAFTDAGGLRDPGNYDLLLRFANERKADQRRTVALTDGLARVFRGNSQWFSHLRALGLTGLDTVSPLRQAFAKSAMGFGSSLPDLHYRS